MSLRRTASPSILALGALLAGALHSPGLRAGGDRQGWVTFSSLAGRPEGAVLLRDTEAYGDRTTTIRGLAVYAVDKRHVACRLRAGTLCEPTYLEDTEEDDDTSGPEPKDVVYQRVLYFENNRGGTRRYAWVRKDRLTSLPASMPQRPRGDFPLVAGGGWREEFLRAAEDLCRTRGVELPVAVCEGLPGDR